MIKTLRKFYSAARRAVRYATTEAEYIEAGTRVVESTGVYGAKARPFRHDSALRLFEGWAYAAAMINANSMASVPLRLYVRKKPGVSAKRNYRTEAEWGHAQASGKALLWNTRPLSAGTKRYFDGRVEQKPSDTVLSKYATFGVDIEEVIEPHPILGILKTVNKWENGHSLTVLRAIDLQTTGNSYLFLDQPTGTPSTIWRMQPHYTWVMPDEKNFVSGYLYGIDLSKAKPFSAESVIHFKTPNPINPYYGMGWFEAAWRAIGLHDSKRTMDLAKFDNMARPDWLLNFKGLVEKGSLQRAEDVINEKLRGPGKQGRFVALSGDVAATPLQWEVAEIGTATRVIEEIAACSGVPVSMLLSNDPGKAGSETARTNYYRSTVKPMCLRDEDTLNQSWVTRFDDGDDYFLAYDPVSFEAAAEQGKLLVGYVAGGILSTNEARAEMGYGPADGGDIIYPPSGLTAGAAAVGGDMGVDQNDDRQNNPKMMRSKKSPSMVASNTDSGPSFAEQAYLGFQKNTTSSGMLANLTDLGELVDEVGLVRRPDAGQPFVPVTTDDGPIVNGKVKKDASGKIIGGDSDAKPQEVISIKTDDTKAGSKPVEPKATP